MAARAQTPYCTHGRKPGAQGGEMGWGDGAHATPGCGFGAFFQAGGWGELDKRRRPMGLHSSAPETQSPGFTSSACVTLGDREVASSSTESEPPPYTDHTTSLVSSTRHLKRKDHQQSAQSFPKN